MFKAISAELAVIYKWRATLVTSAYPAYGSGSPDGDKIGRLYLDIVKQRRGGR